MQAYSITFFATIIGSVLAEAADNGNGGMGWQQFGLLGLVLGAGFLLLKKFFENTMKQQDALVDSMTAIRDSTIRTVDLLGRLDERITRHMQADESTDRDILRAIQDCHRDPRREDTHP